MVRLNEPVKVNYGKYTEMVIKVDEEEMERYGILRFVVWGHIPSQHCWVTLPWKALGWKWKEDFETLQAWVEAHESI